MLKVIIADLERYKKRLCTTEKDIRGKCRGSSFRGEEDGRDAGEILMDRFGYCRTMDVATYERNKEAADAESRYVLTCRNTDRLCIFHRERQASYG